MKRREGIVPVPPLFSVVICTFNGEHRIGTTLDSIFAQQYYSQNYEIVVVDDGSTDQTVAVVRRYPRVRLVQHEKNLGHSQARNTGLQAAKGKWIAFLDDDCTADPQWLHELQTALEQDGTLGVASLIAPERTRTISQRYLFQSGYGQPARLSLGKARSPFGRLWAYVKDKYTTALTRQPAAGVVQEVYGASAAFPTEKVRQAGGYDPAIRSAEDREICARLHRTFPDDVFRFVPQAKIRHDFMESFWGHLRKLFVRQGDALAFYRQHRQTPPLFPFPVAILALTLLSVPFIGWYAVVVFLAAPLVFYSWWVVAAMRVGKLEYLWYVYMQCAEELVQVAGLVRAMVQMRKSRTRQRTSLRSALLTVVATLAAVAMFLAARRFGGAGWHFPLGLLVVTVPGYLLARALGLGGGSTVMRVVIWQVAGITWLLATHTIATVLLPHFGVVRPLAAVPVLATWLVGIALLLGGALRRQPVPLPSARHCSLAAAMIMSASPLVLLGVFVGAGLLNNNHSNVLLLLSLGAATAMLFFTALRIRHLPTSVPPLVLFTVSLACVWSYSLRSSFLFGWDIQQEYAVLQATQAAGTWVVGQIHSPYDAMLSLTVLPASLMHLSGLSGLTIYKVLFPVFFSLVPVLLYATYRQFAGRFVAFAAAGLFVAQFPFMQQFSATVRQQLAFLFFAGLLYALAHKQLGKTRHWLLFLCSAGLIVSHYSTTYVAIVLLGGTYVLVMGMGWFRKSQPSRTIVPMWVVLFLLVGGYCWYGPATHMGAAQTKGYSWHSLSRLFDFQIAREPQKDTATYLDEVGDEYHAKRPYLEYYQADNSGVAVAEAPEITPHSPLLYALATVVQTVLRLGLWVIGATAIGLVAWHAYRQRNTRQWTIALAGGVSLAIFSLFHVVPQLDKFYNISRLNQQLLMFVAPFAIVGTLWVMRGFVLRWRQVAIASLLALSLLFATGLANQAVGGSPTANLNNFGADYQRFYLQQTDLAASQWLHDHYQPQTVIYADRYAQLHLTTQPGIHGAVLWDVTPASLSRQSYIYAGRTNVVDGVAASGATRPYTYQFPQEFIQTHKNTLYSNGTAEIYK